MKTLWGKLWFRTAISLLYAIILSRVVSSLSEGSRVYITWVGETMGLIPFWCAAEVFAWRRKLVPDAAAYLVFIPTFNFAMLGVSSAVGQNSWPVILLALVCWLTSGLVATIPVLLFFRHWPSKTQPAQEHF